MGKIVYSMKFSPTLKEVYRTSEGCIYQCDKNYCFWVEFGDTITSFKVPCFFALKKKIDNIDIEAMATNPSKSFDFEIIHPCGSERIYLLSLNQAIAFKDLLAGAKVMLELNSILRERLHNLAILS